MTLLRPCPVCNAPVGAPCNAPTNDSRRQVAWFHHRRSDPPWVEITEGTA